MCSIRQAQFDILRHGAQILSKNVAAFRFVSDSPVKLEQLQIRVQPGRIEFKGDHRRTPFVARGSFSNWYGGILGAPKMNSLTSAPERVSELNVEAAKISLTACPRLDRSSRPAPFPPPLRLSSSPVPMPHPGCSEERRLEGLRRSLRDRS